MNIKVNGITISVENTNVAYDYNTIEKDSIAIENMSNNINKSIEALNIISNIKAVESFGYKSTEGVADNIKKAANTVWTKIKEFFKKIVDWCVKAFNFIKTKILVFYNKIKYRKLKTSNNIFDKLKYKIIIKRAEAGKEAYVNEADGVLYLTKAEEESLTNAVNSYINYFGSVREGPWVDDIPKLDAIDKNIVILLDKIKKFDINGSPEDLGKIVEEIKQNVNTKTELVKALNTGENMSNEDKRSISEALDDLKTKIGFNVFKNTYSEFIRTLERYVNNGNTSLENDVDDLKKYCEQQLAILGQNNSTDYMKTNESNYSRNIKYKYNAATYIQSNVFKNFKIVNFMEKFCNSTIEVDNVINKFFGNDRFRTIVGQTGVIKPKDVKIVN